MSTMLKLSCKISTDHGAAVIAASPHNTLPWPVAVSPGVTAVPTDFSEETLIHNVLRQTRNR